MDNKDVITLEESKDLLTGKPFTPKRDAYEKDNHLFYHPMLLEIVVILPLF